MPSLEDAAAAILAGDYSVALVIADRKEITARTCLLFSDTVAKSKSCHSVSFLMSSTSQGLEMQARRLRPAPVAEPSSKPRLLLLHPDFQKFVAGLSMQNDEASILAAGAAKSGVGRDCSVLYLIGHSSGFDEGFEKTAICRRPAEMPAPADFRALPCFYGAACRYDQPVLIPHATDIIAAQKVVNISCWGFGIQDHMFAPELTVGQGLLEASSLDSMITSIRVFPFDRSDMLSLYYLINQGLSFGQVTALTNKLRLQRGKRADFVCFGDPEGSVERSQQEIECHWNDTIGMVRDMNSSTSADVAVAFPKHIDQADKVVLIGPDAAGASCGLSASGHIFISRSSEPCPDELVLRLLQVNDNELSVLHSPKLLIPAFYHLEHVVRALGSAGAPDEPKMLQLAQAVDQLRGFLMNWPLSPIQGGDVIRAVEIANGFHDLASHLNALGHAFADLYLSLVGKGSVFFLLIGNPLGATETTRPEKETCRYCGEPVDESEIVSWTGQLSRIAGCCHVCGPIYDVSPGQGKWISSGKLCAGADGAFAFEVQNPDQFPVNAFAAVAISPFGRQSAVTQQTRMMLAAGEAASLQINLDIPATLTAGTYYAVGFILLGTSLSVFRKPVIVQR